MFSLKINGMPAVIKKGTNIKITKENPAFSEKGSYTLEVTLPLKGCVQNQKIFGSLHRTETRKNTILEQQYSFRLQADALEMDGQAHVKSVTDDEVKVQLSAIKPGEVENAVDKDGSDIYIDRLDLGYACGIKDKNQMLDQLLKEWRETGANPWEREEVSFYPIYSEKNGKLCNPFSANIFHDGEGEIRDEYRGLPLSRDGEHPYFGFGQGIGINTFHPDYSSLLAPQPELLYMIKKVFAAIGYEIDLSEYIYEDSPWKDIIIANVRTSMKLCDTLPHWTVKEFVEEIQKFFGARVEKYNGKYVLRSRNSTVRKKERTIVRVVDEFQTDLDADAKEEDITVGNVGYDFPHQLSGVLVLSDEVWEKAEVVRFDSAEERAAWDSSLGEDEKQASHYIACIPPGQASSEKLKMATAAFLTQPIPFSIELKVSLTGIDIFGPLIRRSDTRDLDIKLRIVPVRKTTKTGTLVAWQEAPYPGISTWQMNEVKDTVIETMLSGESVTAPAGTYSVNKAILGEEQKDEDDKGKVLEVAKRSGHLYTNAETFYTIDKRKFFSVICDVPYVDALIQVHKTKNIFDEECFLFEFENLTDRGFFLLKSASADPSAGSLYSLVLEGGSSVSTRCETMFSFVDEGDFNPDDIFLIKGRKYVCHKIEITVDEKGIQPLKTGYFYEIG